MSDGDPRTVSLEPATAAPARSAEAQLILLLRGDAPLEASSRHLLADLDEVVLGRGEARALERSGRRLTLQLPDRAMSQRHARLSLVRGGHWLVEDLGSKNGVVHNGTVIRRGALRDGDLLELGQSLFLFRDAVAPASPGVPDLDATRAPSLGGLQATFVDGLAAQYEPLAALARTEVPVIILGESGTGKEVAARAIHAASGRPGALAALNCGAIPKDLVEATLFGHRRGAFSGAVDDRPGVVRGAERGTLFLDEIGDLPLASQVAFLRVLQEQEVVPVGDTRAIPVDFRLVAATHRSPVELIERGAFRHDLYARIAGFTLHLPRLAERREDLGLLVAVLLQRLAPEPSRITLSIAAARQLASYAWPLNVRELESSLRIAVALAGPRARIDVEHLPEAVRRAGSGDASAASAESDEADAAAADDPALRAELVALLTEHRGNVSRVAEILGKGRMQVHRWLRRLGLDADAFRG